MNKPLTERQKELLTVIYEFIKNSGYPPTFEEMREKLGVSSNQSVIDLLSKLIDLGFVRRNESAARGLTVLPLGYAALGKPPLVAFLGATTAGAPIEAIEIVGEWQEVLGDVARLKDNVFLFKVIGDSMINAGIDDKDVVLVKEHKEFVSTDVVLAQYGDMSTIKRFISDDKPPYVYLKPENPAYPVIPFDHRTKLIGKVISVLKHGYWQPIQ